MSMFIVGDPSITLSAVEAQFGFLKGRVLTIVDATYPAAEAGSAEHLRRKAVKDLIHEAFANQLRHIQSTVASYEPNETDPTAPKASDALAAANFLLTGSSS
jgi:hypothetical protein